MDIPSGNIKGVERFKRLVDIKQMLEDGKTVNQISEESGIEYNVVKRNIKYLDELRNCDLSASSIASKRAEIYTEALEASAEARSMYEKNKEDEKPGAARTWFISWLDTLRLRMTLYGLDSVKIGPLTQINQNFNSTEPEKIDMQAGAKLAAMMKGRHEAKLTEKINCETVQELGGAE